jgi:hypothetical protein
MDKNTLKRKTLIDIIEYESRWAYIYEKTNMYYAIVIVNCM